MKIRFLSLSLLALIMNSACNKTEKQTADFSQITKSYFQEKSALNPIEATFYNQSEYNAGLELDMTEAFRKRHRQFFEKFRTQLDAVDTTGLDQEEKISYDIMKWEIERGETMLQYQRNLIPLHQFEGTHLFMAILASGTSAQPFKNAKDYDNFHARMEKYAVWLDSAIVYMRKGIRNKSVLPKVLSQRVATQFEDMISANAEDNVFYTAVKTMPESIDANDKKAIADKYSATISGKLIPRFRTMVKFLREEYIPASRTTSGIGAIPQGREMYAALVKQWTTTDMTPEEIHQLGLREVARLTREMEDVKKQVGFTGTIKEFFDHVRSKKN